MRELSSEPITVEQFKELATVSKYKNEKVYAADGMVFDSKREYARWLVLRTWEQCGEISDLKHQIPLHIEINGIKVCRYICDFVYKTNDKTVYEDCKGFKTAVYRLKKKLVQAVHGIEIKES